LEKFGVFNRELNHPTDRDVSGNDSEQISARSTKMAVLFSF